MVAPDGSSLSEEQQTMESLSRSLAGGRYRIMRILGAGAMGSVRLAEDTALHRRVAIKTVKEEVARDPEIRRRIERECLLHAKVGPHPNIVTLFDKLEFDDEIHLVMEYVDGETLQARLERNSDMGIVMPPSESILIASQVLDALSRIHAQGIVHRDIKPSNIMLTYTESGTVCAKLMDFGVSRLAEHDEQLSRLTTTNSGGPGTPLYMAPEQIDSKTFGDISFATDVYAMGILLFQLLSGKPPFRGTLTEVLNGHLNMPVPHIVVKLDGVLPEAIEGLLKRALAKKTADRIQTAKAFREEMIAITGVGDTMSRLNATVQLGSASSVKPQSSLQPGVSPLSTQTFFGGNTMQRLARYRRSMRVLGVGVAFVVVALIATAVMMMRGPANKGDVQVAGNQPVGEVVSGALTQPIAAAPVPPAGLEQGTTVAPATPTDISNPVASVPGEQQAGTGAPIEAALTPGTAPPQGTEQAAASMLAYNQPNAMTPPAPAGTPVIIEGATVQTPTGEPVPAGETGKEYTVKSGDTLSKIAGANSITVEDLRWWNNILNPYSLKVGQVLKLYAAPDLQPKEQFLAQAVAAEKARKEAAAKSQEVAPAPQPSAPSTGGTLESQFKGTPVEPAPPPAKKDEKPKRGLFRGILHGR